MYIQQHESLVCPIFPGVRQCVSIDSLQMHYSLNNPLLYAASQVWLLLQ